MALTHWTAMPGTTEGQRRRVHGQELLIAYAASSGLDPDADGWDVCATDAIADVLHYASEAQGLDVEALTEKALSTYYTDSEEE